MQTRYEQPFPHFANFASSLHDMVGPTRRSFIDKEIVRLSDVDMNRPFTDHSVSLYGWVSSGLFLKRSKV